MAKDFIVTITNPERAAEWERVFGTTSVCVQSFVPFTANLPGLGWQRVYLLDTNELTAEQKQNLINHIAAKFQLSVEKVAADIDQTGVPILDKDCCLTVQNPQRWL